MENPKEVKPYNIKEVNDYHGFFGSSEEYLYLRDDISYSCSGCPKRMKLMSSDYDQEQDQHNDHLMKETCTPSYRLLPQNLYGPTKYDTPNVAKQVLNDTYGIIRPAISCPKKKNISQYDKVLNMLEEDRFEADMFLERLKSTAENVEAFFMRLLEESQPNKGAPIRFDEFLDARNLRSIEQLYDIDQGPEMRALLRQNPAKALLRILTRLDKKMEECEQVIALMKIIVG